MVGTAGVMAHEYTGRNRMCSKYLEIQGIKVPSTWKLVEGRPNGFDNDEYVLAGGLLGILAAARRGRFSTTNAFSLYFGSFVYGGFAGVLLNLARGRAYWNEDHSAEMRLKRAQSSSYTVDIAQKLGLPLPAAQALQHGFMLQTSLNNGILGSAGDVDSGSAMHSPMIPSQIVDAGPPDMDEKEPRPHLSAMENGRRVFQPLANLDFKFDEPGQLVVREHLSYLQRQREELRLECESLMRERAKHQAAILAMSKGWTATDAGIMENIRLKCVVNVIGEVAAYLYREAGNMDWLIDDTKLLMERHKAGSSGQYSIIFDSSARIAASEAVWAPTVFKQAVAVHSMAAHSLILQKDDLIAQRIRLEKQLRRKSLQTSPEYEENSRLLRTLTVAIASAEASLDLYKQFGGKESIELPFKRVDHVVLR